MNYYLIADIYTEKTKMIIADVAILILMAGMAVLGFINGCKKSLISLFGFLISLTAALIITKIVADALLNVDIIGKIVAGNGSSLSSFIKNLLPKNLNNISVANIRACSEGVGASQAAQNLKTLFSADSDSYFMNLCYPLIKHTLTNSVYLNSGAVTAADIIALELSYAFLCIVTALVLFIVIRLIVALIFHLFRSKQPKRKSFSGRFLGTFIGAVKGFAYSLLIFCLLSIAVNFSFMKQVGNEIEKSRTAMPVFSISISLATTILVDPSDDPRYARLVSLAEY